MIDIYEIYTTIRAYWFDYGKVSPHTARWIDNSYSVDIQFSNDSKLEV